MRALAWLVWRELLAEWRGRDAAWAALLFGLSAAVAYGFALDPVAHDLDPLLPGLVITTLAFAAVLVLARGFAREREAGGLDGLAALPVDRAAVLYAKALAAFAVLAALAAVLLPVLVALLGLAARLPWLPFLGALALGGLGLALGGTVVAALAAQARAAEALLPVLLAPLVLPVVLAVARIGAGLAAGAAPAELALWYRLLGAYDMVLGVIPLAVAEAILGD